MKGKKILGILMVLSQFFILSAYAIMKFIANNSMMAGSQINNPNGFATAPSGLLIFSILSAILGALSIISIFVFIPVGIYLLASNDEKRVAFLQQQEKYKNLPPEQIQFIAKWSWGAFFGGLVWALGNKLYLWALLSLIPFVNIYTWIKLSFDGRRMAWEEGWTSFDEFKKRQKIMAIIITIFIFLPFIIIAVMLPILAISGLSSARMKSENSLRLQQEYMNKNGQLNTQYNYSK